MLRSLFVGTLACLLSSYSLAQPVTVTFAGSGAQVFGGDAGFSSLFTDASFSGTFTYDSATPGISTLPGYEATYPGAILSASFTIGSHLWTAGPGGRMFVANGLGSTNADSISAEGFTGLGAVPVGSQVAGSYDATGWVFIIVAGNPFSDESLPLFVASDAFAGGVFAMTFSNAAGVAAQITADIASYSFTPPVPEPEAYAMLLAGLVLLGFEARRRKKVLRAAA